MSLKTAFFRLNDSSAAFEMVIFQKQNALEYLNVNWLAHMQAKRPFRQSGGAVFCERRFLAVASGVHGHVSR